MQKVVECLHLKYTAAMIHSVHMSFNKFVKEEQLKKVVFQIFLQYFILYWVMLKKEKL